MNELASTGQLRAALARWLLVLVPSVLLLGYLSGALGAGGASAAWFDTLTKPAILPTSATIGIIWPVLYVLIGVAAALVAAARGAPVRRVALIAFAVQFAMVLVWSPLFFGARQITAGLILLVAVDIAVIITIALFHRVRPLAALLLVPYLLWLGFATYLNWEVLRANPGADGKEASGAVSRIEF